MILNVYKPRGPTSHDMVDMVRNITGERRVGHAGTLDPFADGVLIVLVGKESTKRQREFMEMEKEYVAKLKLGETSDTDDPTGKILNSNQPSGGETRNIPTEPEIKKVLSSFVGKIEQLPPVYSAKKIGGKKAYELARQGETPNLKPTRITIHEIALIRYQWPQIEIRVRCSSGTYIRALARDIGEKLACPEPGRRGCGAYLESLTRTAVGPFGRETAKTIDQLRLEW